MQTPKDLTNVSIFVSLSMHCQMNLLLSFQLRTKNQLASEIQESKFLFSSKALLTGFFFSDTDEAIFWREKKSIA